MDGKQVQMQMQSPMQNQTNLDDFINQQANLAQTIQLIDVDGCPTDSNIMGQLVKLDPTGRRYLAPFDAFKFPSSDVVFFRAVITTCVAECKIAPTCSTNNLAHQTTQLELRDNLFTNRSAPIDSSASTRNLLINNNNFAEKQSSFGSTTTTTLTTEFSSSPSTTTQFPLESSTTSPIENQHTNINNNNELASNRDLTTTIAGFNTTPANLISTSTINSLFGLNSAIEQKFALDGIQNDLINSNDRSINQLENQLDFSSQTTPTSSIAPTTMKPNKSNWLQQDEQFKPTSHNKSFVNVHNSMNDYEREPESRSSLSPPDLPPIEILNDLQRDLLVKLLKETRRRVAITDPITTTTPIPTIFSSTTSAPSDIANSNNMNNTNESNINLINKSINSRNFDNTTTNNESLVAQIDKLLSRLEAATIAKKMALQQADGINNDLTINDHQIDEVTTINVINMDNNTQKGSSLNQLNPGSPSDKFANLTTNGFNDNNNEQQNFFLEKALDETLQEHLRKLERVARQSSMMQKDAVQDDAAKLNGDQFESEKQDENKRKKRDISEDELKPTRDSSILIYKQLSRWDPSMDQLFRESFIEAMSNDNDINVAINHNYNPNPNRVKRQAILQPNQSNDDSLLVQSIKIMDRMEFDPKDSSQNRNANKQTKSNQQSKQQLQQSQRQFVPKNSLVTNHQNKQKGEKIAEFLPSTTNILDDNNNNLNPFLNKSYIDSDDDNPGLDQQHHLSSLNSINNNNNWTTLTLVLVIASISFFLIQFLLIFTFAYWSSKSNSSSNATSNCTRKKYNNQPSMMIISSPHKQTLNPMDLSHTETPSPNSSTSSHYQQNPINFCGRATSLQHSPGLSSLTSSSLLLTGSDNNNSNLVNGRRLTTGYSNWTARPTMSNIAHCQGRRQFR